MQWLESIILGLIQGLTEFIPVSSSGHLTIAQHFMNMHPDHLYLEFINIGTTLALLVFFRAKIWEIIQDVFVRKNYRLARNILLTALPAGIVGYLLAGFIGSADFFSSLAVIAISLTVVGVVMIFVEKLPKASPVESGEKLSVWRALTIGLVQTLALIPGVSRSGTTILTGRFVGLSSAASAEYSFLASIPIMVGVILKVLVSNHEYLVAHIGVILVSNAVAFTVGLFAVGFLLRYLEKHSLAIFGWYRVALALVIVAVLLVQWG